MSERIRVNMIACDGVGICAHLAPDVVRVDSWGFPILPDHALAGAQARQAKSAVTACPKKALFPTPD